MSPFTQICEENRAELLAFYERRIALSRTERSKNKWRARIEFMNKVLEKQNKRNESC